MRELQNSISSDGEVRRETHSGREYAIFPSIIAKEGVMDYPEFGRKEYLPAEALQQSADHWADVPITVNHPPDRGNGRTAQIPESYTSEVIGRLFNPEIVGNDRLRGEIWVDVEKSRDLGDIYEDVVNSLLEGEEVGVSTGYAAAEEVQNGVYDGESYDLVQTDIFPNHLSLLTPDKTPRMGPEDGVGAPRLNHVDVPTVDVDRTNVRSQARTPTYSGTESSSWGDVSKTFENFVQAVDDPPDDASSVDDLNQSQRGDMAELSLLGSSDGESFQEVVFFPVVNPSNSNLNEGALDAVLGGRGSSADISDSALNSARSTARRLLNDEFDRDLDNERTNMKDDTDEMDIGMLRSGIRRLAEATGIRLNQETGDAVRWDSDAGGEREPSGTRYGVVVDGLNASDEPDDSVLVAVYRANSDYDGWENAGEQQAIQTDTLEVVGNDGVDSLPAISQVFDRQNALEDGEDVESDSGDPEEAEADDSGEADAESTDSTDDNPEDGDDADPEDSNLLETMSDDNTDFDRNETIESLDSDEDVPFDKNVLEEMTDEQIRTISPDASDGEEPPDGVDDGRKEEGTEEDADASAEDDDEDGEGEEEGEEENPDAETETTDSPETPGDDSTETKVEMTVNELAERLNSVEEQLEETNEELEETKQENEKLREKVDPDVIKAKQAREQLAEATETDAEELAALPDETAINMASNLDDGAGMARANTMPSQQGGQQRPNMAGAPGPVSRTNTEDEDLPPAGREAYEQRKNGDS